jgi:hypothetical protein
MKLGYTFSTKYCLELGLNPRDTFTQINQDLGFEVVRLCAYWDELAVRPDQYDWEWLDYLVEYCEKVGVKVVMAVGRKLPRWPEYHEPNWTRKLIEEEFYTVLDDYIKDVIERYKKFKHVVAFQIENEAFYDFGFTEVPIPYYKQQVVEEVVLARTLTKKPIILTDSGENSDWKEAGELADKVGINLYRKVYDAEKRKYHTHGYLPFWYTWKTSKIKKKVFVAELQAEPWAKSSELRFDPHEWAKTITPEQVVKNLDFAHKAGFSEVWFWGVEWWYKVKGLGYPEFVEAGKGL